MTGSTQAVRFDRYTILGKWATGGMASVYVARQIGAQGFDKLVGLKLLKPELVESREFVDMFFTEACTGALLQHPNIVQTYDVGESNGRVYMALEFINGETLSQVIRAFRKRGQTVPIPFALEVCADVADALHYAHTLRNLQGQKLELVHRDVSPSNIMLSHQGGVKLLDFGIAKVATRAAITKTGQLKGKFAYMSPEQARSEKLDGRSDVFALALVLWQMLTGKRAFEADHELIMLNAIVNEPLPLPSEAGADASDVELDALVLKGAEKDRDLRFESAKTFAEALRAYRIKRFPQFSKRDAIADVMQEFFSSRSEKLVKLVSNPDVNFDASSTEPEDWSLPSLSNSTSSGTPSSITRTGPRGLEKTGNTGPAAFEDTVTSFERPSALGLSPEETPRPAQGNSNKESVSRAQSASKESKTLPAYDPNPSFGPPEGSGRMSVFAGVAALIVVVAVVVGVVLATKKDDNAGAEAPAAAAAEPLTLTIRSTPGGAEVRVNGKDVGVTPEGSPLELSVETGSSASVVITRRGYKLFRAQLEDLQADSAFVDAALERADEFGSVVVNSEPPGASITVDGRALDVVTPTVVNELWIGEPHAIQFALPGYKPKLERVTFEENRHAELNATLEQAERGYVAAFCAPTPCDVYIDGRNVGVTPIKSLEQPSNREITIELRRGAEALKSKTLTLDTGSLYPIEVKDPALYKHLKVTLGSFKGEGVSRSKIKSVLGASKESLHRCYIDLYEGKGPFSDRLEGTLALTPTGAVSNVALAGEATPDTACLTRVFDALTFPAPKPAEGAAVSFNLKLSD